MKGWALKTLFGVVGVAIIGGCVIALASCTSKTSPLADEPAAPPGHPVKKTADCLSVQARLNRRPAPRPTAANPLLQFRPNCPPGDKACAAWTQFRQDHPYPYQSFAGERLGGGKAVLVISEPPPNLSHADAVALVDETFRDRASTTAVRRWMIGSDGYVEDIVVTFDAPELSSDDLLSDPDLRDRMALLQQAWFGTSCGGDVEVIGQAPVSSAGDLAPNLRVTAAELTKWMDDPALLWARIENDRPVGYSWAELSGGGGPAQTGAFATEDHSLTLLTFDRASLDQPAALAALKADFRRFAVSSDAIVGAVWTPSGRMGIVGRGRTHALSEIPALRFETFALIAAQHADQLQQSYERTNPLAGKMPDARDWAPIYLSPALVDTEFGALLNITDQMLKSWSEAGTVNYTFFNYPLQPGEFPFKGKPLSDLLMEKYKTSQVLFNWNTSGSAVLVKGNNLTVMTSRQLGALPVTYGSELKAGGDVQTGQSRLVDYEDVAYDYFATRRDPNLARVVQYTLIYQALQNCPTGAALTTEPPPRSPQMTALAGKMKGLLAQLRAADPSLARSPEGVNAANALNTFLSQHSKIDLDQLASLIVDERNTGAAMAASGLAVPNNVGDPNLVVQKLQQDEEAFNARVTALNAGGGATSSEQSSMEQQRASLEAREHELNDFMVLMNDSAKLSRAVAEAVGASNLDLSQVREAYERAGAHPVSGWIRTPTNVVSWGSTLVRSITSTGGHNIVARALPIEVDESVQGVVLREDGRILYNPDQADKVGAHADELSRLLEHRHGTQAEVDEVLRGATRPLRARAEALADGAGGGGPLEPPVARLGGRSFQTTDDLTAAMMRVKADAPCCRVLVEGDDGFSYLADTNPSPPPVLAVTAFGDTVSVGRYLRRHPGDDLIVLGRRQSHVEAMMASFELADEAAQDGRTLAGRFRGLFDRRAPVSDAVFGLDLNGRPGTLISEVADVGLKDARVARLADLSVPMRELRDVGVLDRETTANLLQSLHWDPVHDGDVVAVRASASFGGGGGGGRGRVLEVLAGFAGGDRGANQNRVLQIVSSDLEAGHRRGARFTQILVTIKADLRSLPQANLQRLVFNIRGGAVEQQLTEQFERVQGSALG